MATFENSKRCFLARGTWRMGNSRRGDFGGGRAAGIRPKNDTALSCRGTRARRARVIRKCRNNGARARQKVCGNASRASFTNGSVAGSGSSAAPPFHAVSCTFGNIFIVAYEKASPSAAAAAAAPHCPFLSSFAPARTRAEFFPSAFAPGAPSLLENRSTRPSLAPFFTGPNSLFLPLIFPSLINRSISRFQERKRGEFIVGEISSSSERSRRIEAYRALIGWVCGRRELGRRLFKGAASIFPFRAGCDADTATLSGIWCALGHRATTKKPATAAAAAARDARSGIGLEASKTTGAAAACVDLSPAPRLVQRRRDCI